MGEKKKWVCIPDPVTYSGILPKHTAPWEAGETKQANGFLAPIEESGIELLAAGYVWPNPKHCRNLGRESENVHYLCLSNDLSLFASAIE